MRVGLITGICGQDGSYLAELLLEHNYYVYGIIRRASDINTNRIDHLYKDDRLILRYGDLTDTTNLAKILSDIKRDHSDMERLEIYNLGAMSHVKVSFELPEYTGQVDAIGTLRLLEAIRMVNLEDKTRFYQASTSEMFGKVQEIPQKETTPFYPRSPYGVAKLYGHWITKNYRESYDMFACSGILFNHETLAGFMPVIFKDGNSDQIDIKPISEVVRNHTLNSGTLVNENVRKYQDGIVEKELYIWDNNNWTKVKFASGYPHDIQNDNKHPKLILSNSSLYLTTADHVIIMDDNSEKEAKKVDISDKVKLINLPLSENNKIDIDESDAELIGNYLSGNSIMNKEIIAKYSLYNRDGTTRIPKEILNGSINIKKSFLRGFQENDNIYVTTSATLAQGLIFILHHTSSKSFRIYVDNSNNNLEYTISLSDCKKQCNIVNEIHNIDNYNGWFYDLETDSGKFHAGIGLGRIHNSPRRGPTFVTRKITIALGKIVKGEQDELVLGNLDASRDWGHAKDYVKGMWLMLQSDKPDDYILSTNECHTVREFVEKSFALKGYDIEWSGSGENEIGTDKNTGKVLVRVSSKYYRPAEVEELLGDSSKARKELNWIPEYSFDELVEEMVESDMK